MFFFDFQAAESYVSEQGVDRWSWFLGEGVPLSEVVCEPPSQGPGHPCQGHSGVQYPQALEALGISAAQAGSGVAIRGQERAVMGCIAASEVWGRPAAGGTGSPPWPAVLRAWVWKGEGERKRRKADTAL